MVLRFYFIFIYFQLHELMIPLKGLFTCFYDRIFFFLLKPFKFVKELSLK